MLIIVKLVVAAQLLFTIGVTCALAFELPSKPLSAITAELREHLQKKLHPEKYTTKAPPPNDTHSDEMMDSHEHGGDNSRIDFNYNRFKFINNKQNYYDTLNKHNYYYNDKYRPSTYNNKFSDKSDNFAVQKPSNQSKNDDSIWKKVKTWVIK